VNQILIKNKQIPKNMRNY